MKKTLALTLLAAITLMTVSCGDKEDDFSCTSNIQVLYEGKNSCGVAILNNYQPYKEYPNGSSSAEYFSISFTSGNKTGAIYLRTEDEVKEGDSFTDSIDNQSFDPELALSLGIGLTENIYFNSYYGSIEVLKLDRTQNLISLSFDITGDLNNGNSHNLSGTITDFYFE